MQILPKNLTFALKPFTSVEDSITSNLQQLLDLVTSTYDLDQGSTGDILNELDITSWSKLLQGLLNGNINQSAVDV